MKRQYNKGSKRVDAGHLKLTPRAMVDILAARRRRYMDTLRQHGPVRVIVLNGQPKLP